MKIWIICAFLMLSGTANGVSEDYLRLLNIQKLLEKYVETTGIADENQRVQQQEVILKNLSWQIDCLRVENGYFLQFVKNKFKDNNTVNDIINIWQLLAYLHNILDGDYCTNVEQITVQGNDALEEELSEKPPLQVKTHIYQRLNEGLSALRNLMPALIEIEHDYMQFQEKSEQSIKELLQFHKQSTGESTPDLITNLLDSRASSPFARYGKILAQLEKLNIAGEAQNIEFKQKTQRLRDDITAYNEHKKTQADALPALPEIINLQRIIGIFYEYEGLKYVQYMILKINEELNLLTQEIKDSRAASNPVAVPFYHKKIFIQRAIFQSIVIVNEVLNNIQNIDPKDDILKIRAVIKRVRTILEHADTEWKFQKKQQLIEDSNALPKILQGLYKDLQRVSEYLNNRVNQLGFCEIFNQNSIENLEYCLSIEAKLEDLEAANRFGENDSPISKKPKKSEVDWKALSNDERKAIHAKNAELKDDPNYDNKIIEENCKRRIVETSTSGLGAHIRTFDHLRRYFNPHYHDKDDNAYPLWRNDANVLDINIAANLLSEIAKNSQHALGDGEDQSLDLSKEEVLNKISDLLAELQDFLDNGRPENWHNAPGRWHPLPIGAWRFFCNIRKLAHRPGLLYILNAYPLHRLYLMNLLGEFHYYIKEWLNRFAEEGDLTDLEWFQLEELFKDLKICRNFSTHDVWRNKERHLDAIACTTIQLHERFRKIFEKLNAANIHIQPNPYNEAATQELKEFILSLEYDPGEYSDNNDPLIQTFIAILQNDPDVNAVLWDIINRNLPLLFHRIFLAGANPNVTDQYGDTLMHAVAKLPRIPGMKFSGTLISAGALPDLKNRMGKTAFDLSRNPEFKNTLLFKQSFSRQKSADQAHHIDPDFHYSIFNKDFLKELLENKDNLLYLLDHKGYLPITAYLKKCLDRKHHNFGMLHLDTIQRLARNADITQRDAHGDTAQTIMEAHYGREWMLERVQGQNVQNRWYADPEMHDLLIMRLQQEGDHLDNPMLFLNNEIYRVLPPLGEVTFGDRLQAQLADIEQTRNGAQRIVLISYNLGNSHWIGAVIRIAAGTDTEGLPVQIEYYDPLDGQLYYHGVAHLLLNVVQRLYPNARLTPSEDLGEFYHQDNDYDCGPLTIENLVLAARRTVDGNAPVHAQPEDNFRAQHADLIGNFAITPQAAQNPDPNAYWEAPANDIEDQSYLERLLYLQSNFTPRAIQLLLANWMWKRYYTH